MSTYVDEWEELPLADEDFTDVAADVAPEEPEGSAAAPSRPAPSAEPGTDAFVHLHTHMETSMLDGASRIEDAAAETARLGQNALAITDHGRMSGTWKFAQACQKHGIKPIHGMEAYLAIGSRFEKNEISVPLDDPSSEGEKTKRYEHITLLAATAQGWRNLVAMHNASHESFWYYPRIDYDLMREHSEGIIVLTGCLAGPVLGPVARHVASAELRQQAAADAGALSEEVATARAALKHAVTALRDCAHALGIEMGGPRPVAELIDKALSTELVDDEDGKVLIPELRAAAAAFNTVNDRHQEALTVAEGELGKARENLARLVDIYGAENVYVEVMEHGIAFESEALGVVADLAEEFGLQMVATNDAHYVHEHDAKAHDAWLALRAGSGDEARVDNPDRFRFNGDGYFIRSGEQMATLREEDWWKQAVANTAKVAARVEADVLPERYLRLPSFPTPPGFEDSEAYFKHLVTEGAHWRYGTKLSREVKERVRREVGVITDMGLADYFLIVADVISWSRSDYTATDWITTHTGGTVDESARARKKPILVGPGRGSAAGSIVSYVLGIVGIDPLRMDLLFERFLDPTRIGMPDIDVDFERGRRDEVLAYMVTRWGRDRVARIGSFQKAKTKAAIKSAARVLGIAPAVQNRLTKAVPLVGGKFPSVAELVDPRRTEGGTIRQVLDDIDNAQPEPSQTPMSQQIMDLAAAFEDLTSGEGIHACGLLISDVQMSDLVPVRADHKADADPDAPVITGWDGKDVDSFGLLKLDVLGLRTLDLISTAIDSVNHLTGQDLTMEDIPDPDDHEASGVAATWRMLAEGRTAAVFQLESSGMTELTEQVAPDRLEDFSALVALYRPGPLSANMHTHYADRKNGRERVDYGLFTDDAQESALIEEVLGSTYGLNVYQEQSMILGQKVAGFDAKLTNRLRKAISKKIEAEFPELGELFIAGARSKVTMEGEPKLAFSASTAERLWDSIKGSAAYAFNKAHSAAYGYVGYLTAWLKANYAAAFGAGMLSVTKDDDKRHATLRSLEAEGITVRAPEINTALASTAAIDETTIVLGLREIKGVGSVAAQIIAERDAGGPFASSADLLARVSDLNVDQLANLAEAGALDEFGPRRGQVMVARSLRARPSTAVPDAEWGAVECWRRQHDRLGVAVGSHPMQDTGVRRAVTNFTTLVDEYGEPIGNSAHRVALQNLKSSGTTVGVISAWAVRALARGQMANLVLENTKARLPGVAWPRTLEDLDLSAIGVGTVVQADVRTRVREIETTDDDGEVIMTTRTELEVQHLHPITVPDDSRPAHVQVIGIDLSALCRGVDYVKEPAPKPAATEPEVPARPAPAKNDQAPATPEAPAGVVVVAEDAGLHQEFLVARCGRMPARQIGTIAEAAAGATKGVRSSSARAELDTIFTGVAAIPGTYRIRAAGIEIWAHITGKGEDPRDLGLRRQLQQTAASSPVLSETGTAGAMQITANDARDVLAQAA